MPAGITDAISKALAGGAATSAGLQRELGVSQPTLSRAMAELGDRVVRIGLGRRTRYGLRRELPAIGSSWSVFTVSDQGKASIAGRLFALAGEQYWFAADRNSLLTDGLPYFLHDLWPQGFIGRTVPRRYPDLELPDRVQDWNDTHVLTYLTRRGEDCVGNFIIGDESLQRYLRELQNTPTLIEISERSRQYPALADAAIAGTIPGSSAGGEQPKFTTTLRVATSDQIDSNVVPVLIKFSPAGADPVSRRWSDLLIAEYVASRTLAAAGLPAVTSNIVVGGGRTFLEVERFDRLGVRGRRGIVSLGAVTNHYLGSRDDWITAAVKLASMRAISNSAADVIRRIATFGRLIGNVDMHFGNLSFFFSLGSPLALAPVYDMLPMLYAPVGGDELPERVFEVPMPTADSLEIWGQMADLAQGYWRAVVSHELVTREFADIALRNAAETERVRAVMA